MYPLIKRLNIDMIRQIYHYNNYSQLDLEYFRYLHKDKLDDVLIELDHFFLRPQLVRLCEEAMIDDYPYEAYRDGWVVY